MSSQLESRQQEVLSLQKSLAASQQEKKTLDKELGCLVRFLPEYVLNTSHSLLKMSCQLKDKLFNYGTLYLKYPQLNNFLDMVETAHIK